MYLALPALALCLTALATRQVREYAPEVLVLAPDAAPGRALSEVGALAGLPGWWALPAVKSGRVFLADGALFTRPSPRVVRVPLH